MSVLYGYRPLDVDSRPKAICPYCGGSGYTEAFGALGCPCNNCLGRGWIYVDLDQALADQEGKEEVEK